MDRPSGILVFALGCIGALAPEIVTLYRLRKHPPHNGFSAYYYLISLVYALLGGVVAIVLPAVTLHAAFYAGITTPITISAATRQKRSRRLIVNAKWTPPKKVRPTFGELLRTHANALLRHDEDI